MDEIHGKVSTVGIAASPEIVWAVISEFDSWKDWNPLYPEASGRLAIGEVLNLTLVLPGGKPEVIRPKVVDWVPHMQLVWSLKLSGGLLRTTRYFEIEAVNDGKSSIVEHGEMFEGLAAPFLPKPLRRQIKRGFIDLSEAMQAEILRRHQADAS